MLLKTFIRLVRLLDSNNLMIKRGKKIKGQGH